MNLIFLVVIPLLIAALCWAIPPLGFALMLGYLVFCLTVELMYKRIVDKDLSPSEFIDVLKFLINKPTKGD